MKKALAFLTIAAIVVLVSNSGIFSHGDTKSSSTKAEGHSGGLKPPVFFPAQAKKTELKIERISFNSDKDDDGINDLDDFIQGAREQVAKKPRYIPDYYSGGYPPEDVAVCTDIVWRAFKNAGYDLKAMLDEDIRRNTNQYPRVGGKPDPNIDFRRVRNLVPFFQKYAESLTTEVKPNDIENLKKWQGGDLVVFYWTSNEHIAIVSDKRDENGVPYLIHTYGSYPKEDDMLMRWADTIVYHFRYPKITER